MLYKKLKSMLNYFSKAEITLWAVSVAIIILSFLIFDRGNFLMLSASLIGTTSLIFNAKGNPLGQLLIIIFSVLYGMISFSFSYYGEMVTYLGMTAPMALFALISWLKNPYNGNKSQVRVNRIKYKEIIFMIIITVIITFIFYHILAVFNTSNLIPSTISVTTSFIAVYLTFRRSAFFAVAYAANDIVLIILWILASLNNILYISVVICFTIFLINDIYGFINWLKMRKRQESEE